MISWHTVKISRGQANLCSSGIDNIADELIYGISSSENSRRLSHKGRVGVCAAWLTPTHGAGTYVIKAGDTLSNIAAAQGTSVSSILAANPSITNADNIYAGQTINLPGRIIDADRFAHHRH